MMADRLEQSPGFRKQDESGGAVLTLQARLSRQLALNRDQPRKIVRLSFL